MTGRAATMLAHRPWVRDHLPVVATGAVLVWLPVVFGDDRFVMSLIVHGLTFAAYAVALNLLLGLSGQLFLCLGALAGLAGYGSSLLGLRAGWPLAASVPVGVVLAAGLAAAISAVAARRRLGVIFLGIVTLAVGLVFTNAVQGGGSFTGGETGLVTPGGGAVLGRRAPTAWLLTVVLLGYLACYRGIERSRLGWALRAQRDDRQAAELAGVDTARVRIVVAALAGAMLGLSGALFAAHEGFVSPRTFDFGDVDIRVLVMLGLGGVGSLLGPVVGAVLVTLIDLVVRPLGQLRLVAYGLLLIVLFTGLRGGIVPLVERGWYRAVSRLRRADRLH